MTKQDVEDHRCADGSGHHPNPPALTEQHHLHGKKRHGGKDETKFGQDYQDKAEEGDAVTITGFTDRVYKKSPEEQILRGLEGGRAIRLTKVGYLIKPTLDDYLS